MCGIAAAVQPTGASGNLVGSLLRAMEHRGWPGEDQECSAPARGLTLGAVRLPIVAPAHGRQPKSSQDGAWTVCFNGEIYNYRQLASSLGQPSIADEGDTQVLAEMLARLGPEAAIDLLDVEGSFLAYHHPTGSLVAARDHLGIKPLYWGQLGEVTLWASEIRPLVGVGCPEIHPVEPGTILRQVIGEPPEPGVSWWSPDRIRMADTSGNTPAAVASSLWASVAARVPVGDYAVALSGGVDSSAVLAMALEVNASVTAYTLAAERSPDLPFARRLCERLHVELVEVPALEPPELLVRLADVVETMETWEWHVLNHAAPMIPLVERIHQDGHRVCLTGEGADELFFGYNVDAGTGADLEALCRARLDRLRDLHRTNCRRLDRMGMSQHIEFRVPFLSRQLVELVVGIDPHELSREGNKGFLRHGVEPWVGHAIAWRPKQSLAKGVGYTYGGSDPGAVVPGGAFGGLPAAETATDPLPAGWDGAARFDFERQTIRMLADAGLDKAAYLKQRSS